MSCSNMAPISWNFDLIGNPSDGESLELVSLLSLPDGISMVPQLREKRGYGTSILWGFSYVKLCLIELLMFLLFRCVRFIKNLESSCSS